MLTGLMLTLLTAQASAAQSPAPVLLQGLERQSGTDPTQNIQYALLSIPGRLIQPAPSPETQPPRLTAQCTRDASGKLRFELLADLGGVPAIAFAPPWRASPGDLYPPRLQSVTVTMEFLGYTKVKPVRREWKLLREPNGELQYATPGLSSANMEPVAFYLQYLRALPTLRLTVPGRGTGVGIAE